MKISEAKLRAITRNILKELFTSKQGLAAKSFLDQDVDPYAYGAEGGDFYEADEDDVTEEDEDSAE